MHTDLLISLSLVIVVGTLAQWIAWRVGLPSILLLLFAGLILGPITGVLDVDYLLGDLLFPIVSLSVAVILFEGGLSLRWRDVEDSRHVVRNLIIVGSMVTWILTSLVAYILLGFSPEIALLLGATLVVTGPTVIIPLLKQIRPSHRVSTILRWEGIIIDPVGAILALLVFELIIASDLQAGIAVAIGILVQTVIIGLAIGWIAGRLLIEVFSRFRAPDSLLNPITLMFLIGSFTISNLIQTDAGLLTVTVMGIVMANQNRFDIKPIIEFKETLQTLLISALFILLAARLNLGDLMSIGPQTVLFVAVLIGIVRPLSVWVSTLGTGISWQERLFLAWMAPRGIVAASVASIFALELRAHGTHGGIELLVPITFSVIIGTVLIYSLTAGVLALRLGLAQSNPQGTLFVGAQRWVRKIALELQAAGFRVVLTDTNQSNTNRAKEAGLEAYNMNILSETEREDFDFSGLGRGMAMTSNDQVNTLSSLHLREAFGPQAVFQLPQQNQNRQTDKVAHSVTGRYLFGEQFTYEGLSARFTSDTEVKTLTIDDVEAFEQRMQSGIQPLFLITADKQILVWTMHNPPRLRAGMRAVVLDTPFESNNTVEETAATTN